MPERGKKKGKPNKGHANVINNVAKKGEVRNPLGIGGGRKRITPEDVYQDLLSGELEVTDKTGNKHMRRRMDLLAHHLFNMALNGNTQEMIFAAKEIQDRAFGRPTQAVQQAVTEDRRVTVEIVDFSNYIEGEAVHEGG